MVCKEREREREREKRIFEHQFYSPTEQSSLPDDLCNIVLSLDARSID